MAVLIVGFDSAWSARNRGAVVAALRESDGTVREAELPKRADFGEAASMIDEWKDTYRPDSTVILIDKPIIVNNATGQRPVEQIVSSSVGKRRGGMQSASTGKDSMFGPEAPVFRFLDRFGGPGNPLQPIGDTCVIETYPVLAIIALGWVAHEDGRVGRLPKYNPQRKKTFSTADWRMLCAHLETEFAARRLGALAEWLQEATANRTPGKSDQDCLDACLCLLVGLHLAEGHRGLMVGDMNTGYIVVPSNDALYTELRNRCAAIGRDHQEWLRSVV